MQKKDIIHSFGIEIIWGLSLSGCHSTRNQISNSQFTPTDSMKIAHIQYTPWGDYINLIPLQDQDNISKYIEIHTQPDIEFGDYGDTVLVARTKHNEIKQFKNISNGIVQTPDKLQFIKQNQR